MITDTTGFVTGSKGPRVVRPTRIKVSVRVRKGAVSHETLLTLSLCESLCKAPHKAALFDLLSKWRLQCLLCNEKITCFV